MIGPVVLLLWVVWSLWRVTNALIAMIRGERWPRGWAVRHRGATVDSVIGILICILFWMPEAALVMVLCAIVAEWGLRPAFERFYRMKEGE